MKIIKAINDLVEEIYRLRSTGEKTSVGLVPTMGALHEGHMSLINEARQVTDIVIASLFVNPTQFNDVKDLEVYPRTEQEDINLLEKNGCDILFMPPVEEMYPNGLNEPYEIDLNGLDTILEGKYRDGHFNGVCIIVEKLLTMVKPDVGFFGIKDFQQVAVVKRMVKVRNLNVQIHACPIKRELSGLAMSSRNALLSEEEKEAARIINWTLRLGKQLVSENLNLSTVKENMLALFNTCDLKLEYLEIVDNTALKNVSEIKPEISCCIAAYCGKVRLIDNIQLN